MHDFLTHFEWCTNHRFPASPDIHALHTKVDRGTARNPSGVPVAWLRLGALAVFFSCSPCGKPCSHQSIQQVHLGKGGREEMLDVAYACIGQLLPQLAVGVQLDQLVRERAGTVTCEGTSKTSCCTSEV